RGVLRLWLPRRVPHDARVTRGGVRREGRAGWPLGVEGDRRGDEAEELKGSRLLRPARDRGDVDLVVLVLRKARLVELLLGGVERGRQLEAQRREVRVCLCHLDGGTGDHRVANHQVYVDPRGELARLRGYDRELGHGI